MLTKIITKFLILNIKRLKNSKGGNFIKNYKNLISIYFIGIQEVNFKIFFILILVKIHTFLKFI